MNTALLAIDLQDAWAKNCPYTTLAIENAVEKARSEDMPVIWAYMDLLPENHTPVKFRDLKLTINFAHAIKNQTQYQPTILPHDNDWILGKNTRSVFGNPANADFLHERNINTLKIVGFRAGQCVRQTAEDGIARGLRIIVPRDLTADCNDRWLTSLDSVFAGSRVELS